MDKNEDLAQPGSEDEQQEQSVADLQIQLAQYTEQLEQLKNLVNQDEENQADYTGLINDVENAINLTNQLIQLKTLEEQQEEQEPSQSTPLFKEGDFCYGLYEGLWYVAVVTRIIDNTKKIAAEMARSEPNERSKRPKFEYLIRYVGYGNTDFVSKERYSIKEYYHPSNEFLQTGTKCLAVDVNDPDGPYQDAVIDKLTEKETVWVSFKGKGLIQEIPLRYIRLSSDQFYDPKYKPKKIKKAEPEAVTVQQVTTTNPQQPGGRRELTESEKIAKKKRKQEKRKEKQKEQEQQLNQKKQNWQSFMNRNASSYKNTGKALQSTEKTYTPAQKKTKHTTNR